MFYKKFNNKIPTSNSNGRWRCTYLKYGTVENGQICIMYAVEIVSSLEIENTFDVFWNCLVFSAVDIECIALHCIASSSASVKTTSVVFGNSSFVKTTIPWKFWKLYQCSFSKKVVPDGKNSTTKVLKWHHEYRSWKMCQFEFWWKLRQCINLWVENQITKRFCWNLKHFWFWNFECFGLGCMVLDYFIYMFSLRYCIALHYIALHCMTLHTHSCSLPLHPNHQTCVHMFHFNMSELSSDDDAEWAVNSLKLWKSSKLTWSFDFSYLASKLSSSTSPSKKFIA
jgi:hypothetical protein